MSENIWFEVDTAVEIIIVRGDELNTAMLVERFPGA